MKILYAPLLTPALAFMLLAEAQGRSAFPEREHTYVNDHAELLNASEENKLSKLLGDLQRDDGVEMVVITINALRDYTGAGSDFERYATRLFNHLEVGTLPANKGIMLLVSKGDRKVRIELGDGYENSMDAKMKRVIDHDIVPQFKRGRFGEGISRGAAAVAKTVTSPPTKAPVPARTHPPKQAAKEADTTASKGTAERDATAERIVREAKRTTAKKRSAPVPEKTLATPVEAPPGTRASNNSQTKFQHHEIQPFSSPLDRPGIPVGPIGGVGGLIAIIGGALGLKRHARYKKRNCKQCSGEMTRLDEVADDAYLDQGQKLEELLNSVDYDVWKCSRCTGYSLESYPRAFSSFKRCPNCRHRTVKVTKRTLSHATYTSTGRQRITRDCRHCDFRKIRTVTLPKLKRSNSSSSGFSSGGGGGGGGFSSGGGASGSW